MAREADRATERRAIEDLFDRLWPLPRSLTGNGVRQTHKILSEFLPLDRHEIPSGTPVFDWDIPKEWRVREAHVIAPDGRKLLDFHSNPLHLVGYSTPFRGEMDRQELDKWLHSKPELPDAIPYITSYYSPRWGFCISENDRRRLPAGKYQVVVDTEHFDGHLTLSETVLPGSTDKE
ncbi:MAG: DUF2172 domain-containing protein, partial [Ferrovibrio sp.]